MLLPLQVTDAQDLIKAFENKIYVYLNMGAYDMKRITWEVDPEYWVVTVQVFNLEDNSFIEEIKILWNEIY